MSIDIYSLVDETSIPNLEKLRYTFMHRLAFRFVLDEHFYDHPMYDELDYRADIHDLDKCLYLILGGNKDDASSYHRDNAPHHMEGNLNPTELDMFEAIIDYECAGFTKEDKPMNAYDTVMVWDKPHREDLIAIMDRYSLASSYENTPDDERWIDYRGRYEVDADEIMSDIDWFCHCEPEWAERIVRVVGR